MDQIFQDEEYKNFTDYNKELEKQQKQFQDNILQQIINVHMVIQEFKNNKLNQNQMNDFKQIIISIREELNYIQQNEQEIILQQSFKSSDKIEGWDQMNMSPEFFQFDELLLTENDDIKVVQQYQQVMNILDETFQLQIQRINQVQQDHQENIFFIDNPQLQQKFKSIFNSYIKNGKDRDFYLERLKIEFPNVNRKEIEEQDQYLWHQDYIKKRTKALYRDFNRQKIQIKQKANNELLQYQQQRMQQCQNEQERLKIFKKQEEIHQQLAVQKDIFMRKLIEQECKDKIKQKQLDESENIKKQKQNEYYNKQKQTAKEYIELNQIKKHKEIAEQKLLQEKMMAEKKKEIELNKHKVQYRQNYENFKIIEKINKKTQKQIDEEIKQQQIQDAIENYSIRPKAEKDPQRLLKNTESNIAKKQIGLDKGDQVNLFKNPGFTVDQLFTDIRYRLGAALYNAGLQNNHYGQSLINQLSRKQ